MLANALSSELSELRRSPLAGLVRAARLNRAHGAAFVGGFEVGTGFGRDDATAPCASGGPLPRCSAATGRRAASSAAGRPSTSSI